MSKHQIDFLKKSKKELEERIDLYEERTIFAEEKQDKRQIGRLDDSILTMKLKIVDIDLMIDKKKG